MGVCLSCCRRRSNSEHEPLLAPQPGSVPEPTTKFQKAIDALAALKANKLPSQNQLHSFLQVLLRSDVLDVGVTPGHGPVGDDARNVVLDVRECLEAALQIGMEKNGESLQHQGMAGTYSNRPIDDDRLQNFLFESSRIDATPIRVNAEVDVDNDVLTSLQQQGMHN
jgi:hypothetical protein